MAMRQAGFAWFGLAAGLAVMAAPATAAPFSCPHKGGEFVFGQEANVNSLDMMTSSSISTRNAALNIFETLLARDENNNTVTDFADSVTEAPDHLSYTFKLRQGARFHNGKPATSADVLASYERYNRVGLNRGIFSKVDRFEAPDPATFVIRMKEVQPIFLQLLSSFLAPPVIVPAEFRDDAPQQLHPVGTGPWQLAEFVPGSHVKLKRYEDYKPNTGFEQRTGFGGYKQACFDTVVFRIVPEPGARVAGLSTGELQGVEDIPTKSAADLRKNPAIKLAPLQNWWIQMGVPNTSLPPTDNLAFRKAVQAVLDMDEIMDAATDGNYRLNIGLQYPNQPDYTEAGKETYNQKNPTLAKRYLAEAGYKGEPVILLTNKDYSSMYNAALVMAEQLKAIGVNAQLKVVDWPTSTQMAKTSREGWNYTYTGWGSETAVGALGIMQDLIPPSMQFMPKDPNGDADINAAYVDMTQKLDPKERYAAWERAQRLALERAYVLPFGALTKMQGVRANVQGFTPFRIPRMSNVWFAN
jgi:peptide/nickel transport system substrate-binding protein